MIKEIAICTTRPRKEVRYAIRKNKAGTVETTIENSNRCNTVMMRERVKTVIQV